MALISVISSISFFFNKPSSPLPTTFNDSNLFLILQAKVASVRIILMVFFFFFQLSNWQKPLSQRTDIRILSQIAFHNAKHTFLICSNFHLLSLINNFPLIFMHITSIIFIHLNRLPCIKCNTFFLVIIYLPTPLNAVHCENWTVNQNNA